MLVEVEKESIILTAIEHNGTQSYIVKTILSWLLNINFIKSNSDPSLSTLLKYVSKLFI